ncbi:MAG TPA: S41 family peptidase [Segetibacter sp.]
MNKALIAIIFFFNLFITSCKKDIQKTSTAGGAPASSVSQTDLLKDSVYLYSKEIYLWDELIPSYAAFNPRQYAGADDQESASVVMDAIRKLQPLDHFSFVTTKEASEGLQTGADEDYGFFVKSASIDKADPVDSVRWFVTYVFDKSTAGLAGVNRGWYINKINNTEISYSQTSIDLLDEIFFGSTTSASFQFVKPDGTTVTSDLSKTSFISNSILHNSVIDVEGKKTGYFVFKQFFGAPSRAELNTVFSNFKAQGISELIVDLRYNPGGSTATQDALADLIAPAAANNQTMYKYVYNQSLQQGNFPLLKHKTGYENESFAEANNTQNFENTGSLNLSRVFFIVSSSTASASELLINNLKPYMDVKLIGDTTYGKPVGYFPVDIFNYSIYPVSFKTVNSAGNADFYSGFAPDKLAPDGVSKNWGDVTEPSLASALKYISTGSFRATKQGEQLYKTQMKMQKQLDPGNRQLESNHFKGMFIEKNK